MSAELLGVIITGVGLILTMVVTALGGLRWAMRRGDEIVRRSDEQQILIRRDFKEDMAALRAEFKEELVVLRAEFKEDMASLRVEIRVGNEALRVEFHRAHDQLRSDSKEISVAWMGSHANLHEEMHQGFESLRAENIQLRTEMNKELRSVRSEIGDLRSDVGSLRTEVNEIHVALARFEGPQAYQPSG